MYQLLLRMALPHEKQAEALKLMEGLIGPTEVSKGCRECRASYDAVDHDLLTFWARWEQPEDLYDFIRSERFRRLLPYVELATEFPHVEISSFEILGGMERIVEAINASSK